MTLRGLKKLSKRAALLLPLLGDTRQQFRAAHPNTDQNYHGMSGFPRKQWERSPCHPSYEGGHGSIVQATRDGRKIVMREPSHPLKGTVMVGSVSGYYEPEWDEEAAWCSLLHIVHVHFTDWGAYPSPLPTRRIRTPSDVLAAAVEIIAEHDVELRAAA